MSMYRSYFLKAGFYAKKGNENGENDKKVYIRHDENGGIYAVLQDDRKGVKLIVNREEYFFNNFDKLDSFLSRLRHRQDSFMKVLRRKSLSRQLRRLDL